MFQDPSSFHTSTPKARKSFVEKIGKTLDKLTTNHQKTFEKSQNLPPSVASTAAWIYPATFYQGPRIHYIPNDPTYYPNYYPEFFEYPVNSPPATRNNAFCACYDNLHGTVRRRVLSQKCKQCCQKSPQNLAKKPQESTLKKLTNQDLRFSCKKESVVLGMESRIMSLIEKLVKKKKRNPFP